MRKQDQDRLFRPDRRRFFEVAGRFGFTTAVVASAGGFLFSDEALAQTQAEEREREGAAEFTIDLATAYRLGASRAYPILQRAFKENIQNFSDGRVYVRLAPNGQLGAGTELVKKVQNNTVQIAQHSLSNFSPYAPVVDLINVPYWVGRNQQFVNVVTSEAWAKQVDPLIEQRGFKALWYVCIDPRVVALRQGAEEPVRTPDDLRGLKFRVPASDILQQFYRLAGANPTPIAWGETTSAIKQGVADALDPAVEALEVFGFRDVLSWITFINAIPDSQVYSCNLEWFRGLPEDVQEALERASEVTFRQNLATVPAARAYSMYQLRQAGVQFYEPTEQELAQWKEQCGHQLAVWDDTKKRLAGSIDAFESLLEAAGRDSTYYVDDLVG
jgi:TRAP-type C4-dicarboxylate transport system substrate-binding protein